MLILGLSILNPFSYSGSAEAATAPGNWYCVAPTYLGRLVAENLGSAQECLSTFINIIQSGIGSLYSVEYSVFPESTVKNCFFGVSQCTYFILELRIEGSPPGYAECTPCIGYFTGYAAQVSGGTFSIRLLPALEDAESATVLASVEPDKSMNLIAKVYDQNNQLVPNVGVQLTLEAKENSGGHHHGDDTVAARTGMLAGQQVLTGNTGPNGLQFSYKAPSVSGDYKIKASCTDGKNCQPEGPDTVWVGYKGLQSVVDNAVYRLIPNAAKDPGHPDNHYLTLTAASRLAVFASLYHAKYPDLAVLHLNDASLERGGIFDLSHNWRSPHWEHCRGAVIDIRANGAEGALDITNPSDPMIEKFRALATVMGADAAWEVPKKKDPSTGKLVDQWDIRHFHTKLMRQEGLQCP